MGTITLPNFRATADVTMDLRLKDGGMYIDWTGLTDIRAWIYSDEQKAMAGRCDVRVDPDDGTVLNCEYSDAKAQYLGVNRVIVQARYLGSLKTYDKPVFNFVRWTADQEGDLITISDPHVDVEIEAADVSSSILENVIAACVKVTDEARDVVDVHRGPAAGFGVVDAEADNNVGTPEVEVETSGDDAAKNFHFKFKNIKGSQGIQGIRGPAGVENVIITVDDSTGTPSAVASVENGILSISLHNVKGSQGNSGYQGAASELEVVNNDDQGGEEAAWSAERGKIVRKDLGDLQNEVVPVANAFSAKDTVNISSLSFRNYYIDGTTGKYTSNNSYKHSIVPVKPGQVVRVTANSTNNASVSFFKSNAAPVAGETPDYSSEYASVYRVIITPENYKDFVVPADAKYMYIYRGSSSTYPYTPASIVISKSTFNPDAVLDTVVSSDPASANLVADAVFGGAEYEAETIELLGVPEQDLSIDGNNAFEATGAHGLIEVEPDDVLKVTGGGGRCAFVSSVHCPNAESSAAAIVTMKLEVGKVYFLRVPAGSVGFLYNTTEGETPVAPSEVVRYTPVTEDKPTVKMLSAGRFTVSGGVLAYVSYAQNRNALIKVKGGHSYTVEFTSDAPTQNLYFISDLPRIGLAATAVTLTINSNHVGKKLSITLNPETDGYYIFRFNKSGGPTVTVNAYDADASCRSVSDLQSQADTHDFWRMNINALTKRSYSISMENGLYASSSSYKHVIIPVAEGQYVKVKRSASYYARLAWFTEADTPAAYGVPPYVPGTSVFYMTEGVLKVPAGAKYLFVYAGSGSAYANFPAFLGISVDYAAMPDIVKDNDYAKTRRILFQMKSTTRAENDVPIKPLMLLHYSDIHGRTINQGRINEFREFFKDYIDDTIQTGDLVTSSWADGSAFGDETDPGNPCKDILCVIGNHDTASKSGSTFYWHTYQGKQAYDRYFAPWIENWNVAQPEGAEENGLCYYYKDYASSKVRMIVLDTFDADADYKAAQQTWCAAVLEDAITEGLAVVMVSHFGIKAETLINGPFSNPGAEVDNPDTALVNDPYIELVKDFIDNGGEFVCWIAGHSHYDAITKSSEATGNQICIRVGNAGRHGSNDTVLWETNSRIGVDFSDWKTFDLFNLMAIDTHYNLITLYRIGSEWDKMGRHIETICIKYTTGEVID